MSDGTVTPRLLTRRTVATAAAWTVPAVAVAAGAPLAAASTSSRTTDIEITKKLGVLGLVGAGFHVKNTGTVALPAGSVLRFTSSGVFGVRLFDSFDGVSVTILRNRRSADVTLTKPLAAGQTKTFELGINISVRTTFRLALVSVPSGYVDSVASNNSASISCLIVCT